LREGLEFSRFSWARGKDAKNVPRMPHAGISKDIAGGRDG